MQKKTLSNVTMPQDGARSAPQISTSRPVLFELPVFKLIVHILIFITPGLKMKDNQKCVI